LQCTGAWWARMRGLPDPMPDYQIGPSSDAGPNDASPVPNLGAHYKNVDEDPDNGDTDYLSINGPLDRETYHVNVAGIPDGAIITNVRIKHSQKRVAAGIQTYRVGLTVSGVDFYGSSQSLNAGTSYKDAEDSWAVHPASGAAWTKAALGGVVFFHQQDTMPIALPRPRLTQCVCVATAVISPSSAKASLRARGPRASLSARAASARIRVKGDS
jgi:hypothetical protein